MAPLPCIWRDGIVIRFYEFSQHPPYWIAHDEDGYWLVPVRDQGWAEREVFVGRVTGLIAVVDLAGIDLGLPLQKDNEAL